MRLAACPGVFTRLRRGVRKRTGYVGTLKERQHVLSNCVRRAVSGAVQSVVSFDSLLFSSWEGTGVGKANCKRGPLNASGTASNKLNLELKKFQS